MPRPSRYRQAMAPQMNRRRMGGWPGNPYGTPRPEEVVEMNPQINRAVQRGRPLGQSQQAQANYGRSQQIDPHRPGGINAQVNAATQGMAPNSVFTPGQPPPRVDNPYSTNPNASFQPPTPVGQFQQGGMLPQRPPYRFGPPGMRPRPPLNPADMPMEMWQGGRGDYGSRMNLPPDAVVTQDFIDRDGDGVDDRYQSGPGGPKGGYPNSQGPMPLRPDQVPPYVRQAFEDRNGMWGPDAGERFDERGNYVGNAMERRSIDQGPPDRNRYIPEQGMRDRQGGSPGGYDRNRYIPEQGMQDRQRNGLEDLGITPPGQPNRPDPDVLGLPLSPEFIAGRRMLDDQLAERMMRVGIAQDQIPQAIELFRQRAGYDQGLEREQINESMNARGLYNSGLRYQAQARAEVPYQRRWQDFMFDMNDRYGSLAQERFGAQSDYQRQLQEMLLGQAGNYYDQPPSSVYQGNNGFPDRFQDRTPPSQPNRSNRRRNRSPRKKLTSSQRRKAR